MTYFKDIELGKASAELEGSYYPQLLLEGFLDPWEVIGKSLDSPTFLFLGYKGSGKSAIGEHLRLISEKLDRTDLFVKHIFLSDFPYGNFSKIITGDAEPESRFPSAWSWILLLNLLDSLSNDHDAQSYMDDDFVKSIEALKTTGLLPANSIKETVIASSKPKYKAKLPALFEIEYDENSKKPTDLQFLHIIQHLKNLLLSYKGRNQHLIVIDGLDDILLEKDIQYQSLAALILETARLNMELFKKGVPAKVIVLCRTELYERLPGPNKNKVRQDLSVELDWYHNPSRPYSSMLVKLINKRAELTDPEIKDLFIKYFPIEIHHKPVITFLLNHTRHTPRDFIQLLVHIQTCCGRRDVEIRQIFAGISNYSSKYFLPEIKDELVGYLTREESEEILMALSAVKKKEFEVKEISEKLLGSGLLKSRDLGAILSILFKCSAIGNIKKNNKGYVHWSFQYRNRHAQFNPKEKIVLHRGLWKGMNII